MDLGDDGSRGGGGGGHRSPLPVIPDDLPKSLDDTGRFSVGLMPETDMFDGWQGQSQLLTSAVPAKPLTFSNLSLGDGDYDDEDLTRSPQHSEARLREMMATQVAHTTQLEAGIGDENAIAADPATAEPEKRSLLQKALNMAASNGDLDRLERILQGPARELINVDAPDEDGTPPLIYASCFGHEAVVRALIDRGGARVDQQDRNQWTALMWAMTNKHKGITTLLLDRGASVDQKTSTGRTALDLVPPDSEMSFYLHSSGYGAGADDFYNPGFSDSRFEEEMAENEFKRRMMMESARDLEVDLGNVGMDDQPEPADEFEEEDQHEFDWNRCRLDQMFVFQESELGHILDMLITKMTPQRSPSQKPIPANMIYLGARYAHYHSSRELLDALLAASLDRINEVAERCQWDMTIMAFWISNTTLLLHYLKKDGRLRDATLAFQTRLADLINEIFILIVRDAERRLDKVLDAAMLDHETIPGFEDITFQHEWKIFKRKAQVKPEPAEKRYRPPSPKQRAKPAPRNVTSLLSSTLFVLDLYDVHSVIAAQIVSQLLYWLGAELFNRVMSNRKYLARTKAMQIRMNISILEDWARVNNRQPEHYEAGETKTSGENTVEAARRHLAPVIQLLQWLQCFSSLDADDLEPLVGTLQQLRRLTPEQLIHAAMHYRPEVGEKGLHKSVKKYLLAVRRETELKRDRQHQDRERRRSTPTPSTPARSGHPAAVTSPSPGSSGDGHDESEHHNRHGGRPDGGEDDDDDDGSEGGLLLDPALMLPFTLPTSTDMLISFGAGFGGVNRERERKYIPTVPPEFLTKLEGLNGGIKRPMFQDADWENEEV